MDLMRGAPEALLFGILVTVSVIFPGCIGHSPSPAAESNLTGIVVSSGSFHSGETIPQQFTCQGENLSPGLSWSAVPPGTASIAVLMEDLDSPKPGFTHWIVYNIPPGKTVIPGNITNASTLPDGSMQGRNDAGRTGYSGPCPPAGNPHRYMITVYALNRSLERTGILDRTGFDNAVKGSIVGEGTIMGTYGRSPA